MLGILALAAAALCSTLAAKPATATKTVTLVKDDSVVCGSGNKHCAFGIHVNRVGCYIPVGNTDIAGSTAVIKGVPADFPEKICGVSLEIFRHGVKFLKEDFKNFEACPLKVRDLAAAGGIEFLESIKVYVFISGKETVKVTKNTEERLLFLIVRSSGEMELIYYRENADGMFLKAGAENSYAWRLGVNPRMLGKAPCTSAGFIVKDGIKLTLDKVTDKPDKAVTKKFRDAFKLSGGGVSGFLKSWKGIALIIIIVLGVAGAIIALVMQRK